MTPREKARDRRLQREYGITLEQYNKVLKHQKGCCAICKRPVPPGKPSLAVDHDHTSGKVRGLLCWTCNKSIAYFKDNIERLMAAVNYLTDSPVSAALGKDIFTAPGRVGTKKRARLLKSMKKK